MNPICDDVCGKCHEHDSRRVRPTGRTDDRGDVLVIDVFQCVSFPCVRPASNVVGVAFCGSFVLKN